MLQHVLHFSHSHDVMIDRIYVVTGVCTILAFVLGSTIADVAKEKASTLGEFPNSMPALATMKYISILAYWIHHKSGVWKPLLILNFRTSKVLLAVSGFVLQFAEERRQWRSSANQGSQPSNRWSAFFNFVQRRITKLYPLYALSVVVGYLMDYYGSCQPVKALLVVPYWIPPYHGHQCWGGAWFIPAIMGCYVVFPFFSSYLRKKTLGGTCTLLCFCFMLAQDVNLHAWTTFWLCSLVMGLAGPAPSQASLVMNPVHDMLSWKPLAWMGELALPLYITNFMAVEFTKRIFMEYHLDTKGLGCLVSQFIVMHAMAWMFWKFCASVQPAPAPAPAPLPPVPAPPVPAPAPPLPAPPVRAPPTAPPVQVPPAPPRPPHQQPPHQQPIQAQPQAQQHPPLHPCRKWNTKLILITRSS
mmetsp:Transcript_77314/g.147086  ORF Transcript_77314/g.147086 Transcript_77314/m.147086 type:complete len:414 (+) Transcript_77314:63-1304(+)